MALKFVKKFMKEVLNSFGKFFEGFSQADPDKVE